MYMQKTYAGYLKNNFISNKNEKMFQAWAKLPVTEEQCTWGGMVHEVQGNINPYLLEACKKRHK
jgi:endonuclease I